MKSELHPELVEATAREPHFHVYSATIDGAFRECIVPVDSNGEVTSSEESMDYLMTTSGWTRTS